MPGYGVAADDGDDRTADGGLQGVRHSLPRRAGHAGYYSVHLDKYDILAEATATARTSAEQYTFPVGQGHILLNLGEGLTNESAPWCAA